MLRQMIVKEWKEKLGLFLFGLAGLLVLALAFSAYSQDKEALDLLMGTLTLVFVPIFALLLGASGFSSEFRDDAWAYLFSRPVRKWQVWLAKYVSLLSLLAVVLLGAQLIAEFHPAVKAVRQMFSIPLGFGEDISFLVLACFLPLSLFTTAFSMSILSEKSHIVVFLAALISYLLFMGLTYGPMLLARLWFQVWSLPSLRLWGFGGLLIPLSFSAASLLTLSRADFSQPRRRAWAFTKFAAVFLAASLGIGFIGIYASVSLRRTSTISDVKSLNGRVYFATHTEIYRFDPATGKRDRLAKSNAVYPQIFVGGGKVAFTTFSVRGSQDLWIIEPQGKKPRLLIRTRDSGIRDAYIPRVEISPAGDKVAFITWNPPGSTGSIKNLWSVNADGSGLKGCSLELAKKTFPQMLGFAGSNRSVLISALTQGKAAREGAQLLRVDLESGAVEILAERVHFPQVQPGGGKAAGPSLVAYIDIDRARPASTLRLLDFTTLERRDVWEADSITGFRWNWAGDKLAFVTGQTKLGIYSVGEGRVLQVKEETGYDLRWPAASLDWVLGDGLVLRKLEKGLGSLSILDGSLRELKVIPLPFSSPYPARVEADGQYAFVLNTGKYEFWSVDLNRDSWKRVY